MMEAVLKDTRNDAHVDEKLKNQVHKVTRDVKDLGQLAGISSRRKLDLARDRGEKLYSKMQQKSREVLERRPMFSLLTAASVGALTGLLLFRK